MNKAGSTIGKEVLNMLTLVKAFQKWILQIDKIKVPTQ